MISKQFKIVNAVLAVLGIAAFIYFQQAMKVDHFAGQSRAQNNLTVQDNNLKSAVQCADDPEINVNKDFLEGRKTYFKYKKYDLK